MFYAPLNFPGIQKIKGIPYNVQDPLTKTNTTIESISTNLPNLNNITNEKYPITSEFTEILTITLPTSNYFTNENSSSIISITPLTSTTISISPTDTERQTSAPLTQETKKNIIKFSNTSNLTSPLTLTRMYTDTNKSKKQKSKVVVLYPIFEKCALLTTDEFWIDLFTKASIGKFKRGFSFKDNYLVFNKNKDKIYLSSDPITAINECLYFFKTKAGIQSETDKMIERKLIEAKVVEANKNIQYTWGDFKKSKTKELFMDEYIASLIEQHQLNDNEKNQLKHILNYGIILGSFGSHNIIFENNRIQTIDGLIFDDITRLFSISPLYPAKKSSASKNNKKRNVVPLFVGKYTSFSEKWTKFLQHFETKASSKHNYNEKFEKSGSQLYSKAGNMSNNDS
jgi:hypothetical protein